LADGETSNKLVAWSRKPAGSYHPSPLVVGQHLYVLYSTGFIACFDAKTGEEVYGRQRLGGTFTASPWAYDGKVCCLNEDGVTFVVKAGSTFELLGKNSLDDMCMASPAIAEDRLFVRTLSKLSQNYCSRQGLPRPATRPSKAE
jgi:outer membrane protein assembly factor BamB